MLLPFYYTKEELTKILKINNIDIDTNIKNCKEYMAFNGWSLSKKRVLKKASIIINNSGVIKNITEFDGYEIQINKRNVNITSVMENETDAMIVCIIEAIKREI